jgi:hypothetical protein
MGFTFMSCSSCPDLFYLLCLVLPVPLCVVLPNPFYLSCSAFPTWPVPPVLIVMTVMFWVSIHGSPVSAFISWQNRSISPVPLITFCLSIVTVPLRLSRSAFTILPVSFCLSRSVFPFCLSISACFCRSSSACAIQGVPFWLHSLSGCHVLAVPS